MLNMEIEKEIDQENKVIAGLNLRQVFCVVLIALFAVFVALVLKLDMEVSIYPCAIFGGLCCLFGWYKPDGIPFEKILLKKIQGWLYQSNTRKYKTKNQYVTMLNAEYTRRRNIDTADKKLAKQIKKEGKRKAKTLKRAKSKAVCHAIN